MAAEHAEGRRLGRAAFLGLSAATVGALFLGKEAIPRIDLAPSLDSVNGFTIYTVINGYPSFHPATFRLEVDGLVEKPLSLSLPEILHHPATVEVRNYQCVTGWSVPNCRWQGIRLSALLDRVVPHPDAHALLFSSFDGVYTESLTMRQALTSDVMVAYALNGKPLSRAQGAPLRLVVPEMYGYKYIKWLNRIQLVRQPQDGFWEVRGYDRDAYIGHSNGYGPPLAKT
ncbi:MAG TPA: molybdopterin-dependent oxidoreductase [Chloroflexota bacterium]|nr:molybdopterin-dependent oxidoreductase [Chloroflexota bacterium]